MITYALAHFHVVEAAGSILLIGLLGVLVLRSSKGAARLIPHQVAIAGVFCQKSLLFLTRKLIILHFRLVLKLELVVLVLAAIWLHDVVDVVDLRMVHLVVRLSLLDALADLQSGPTIADIVPVGRFRFHLIELVLVLRRRLIILIDGACELISGVRLVVELQELLLQLLQSLVGFQLVLLTECDCVTATELVQDFGGWLRSQLAERTVIQWRFMILNVVQIFH